MPNIFAQNIRAIREKWRISQEEFGFLINASRGMVMQYEKRGSIPRPGTMKQIVSQTGISKDMLLNHRLEDDDIPYLTPQQQMVLENLAENPHDYQDTDDDVEDLMSIETNETTQEESTGLFPVTERGNTKTSVSITAKKYDPGRKAGRALNEVRAKKIEQDTLLVMVPVEAQSAGSKYLVGDNLDKLGLFHMPDLPYRGLKYQLFQVDGDAMTIVNSEGKVDGLLDGQWIIAERVDATEGEYGYQPYKTTIVNYDIYVMVERHGMRTRRLYQFANDNTGYVAVSDNPRWEQEWVESTGIVELWHFKKKIDFNAIPPRKVPIKPREEFKLTIDPKYPQDFRERLDARLSEAGTDINIVDIFDVMRELRGATKDISETDPEGFERLIIKMIEANVKKRKDAASRNEDNE